MIGTLVNVLAILAGSLLGCMLKRGLPERIASVVTSGLGLCVVLIGMRGALGTQNLMIVILSVVLGGALGALIGIEKRLDRLGERVQKRFSRVGGEFGKGFVSATLLYCVGAMAVVGALDSGLRGEHGTLFAKALLDGVSSVILASTLGAGVALSAVCVLAYQGGIALLGQALAPILTDAAVAEMSAVGGVLIVGIGLNLIRKEHIPVGDMLPAIFVPLLLVLFM